MSLFLRNLFFALLQPGMVAGLFPYLNLRSQNKWQHQEWNFHSYAGILLWIPGLIILVKCITDFARKGKGTLSPADPTKKLVVTGLYRYSRNPMYVGVMLMLVGEAIFFQSDVMAGYAILVFLLFYGFVIWFEEPRLNKAFGQEYVTYKKEVSRWI
jgi:protein-S-isoprenylcysteine O-methyltransferase Ste14